jgi:hypothetical protein
VDALNLLSLWLPRDAPRAWWKCVVLLPQAIASFVAAACRAGLHPVAFIDAGQRTDEAVGKWRSRREREVVTGQKHVPQVCVCVCV